MKHKITIQQKNDVSSFVVDLSDQNYTNYKTIWAKVEYTSVKEIFKAEADTVVNTLKFVIRYRTDLEDNMRILFNTKHYEIKGIRPLDDTKMYLIIIADLIKHEDGE